MLFPFGKSDKVILRIHELAAILFIQRKCQPLSQRLAGLGHQLAAPLEETAYQPPLVGRQFGVDPLQRRHADKPAVVGPRAIVQLFFLDDDRAGGDVAQRFERRLGNMKSTPTVYTPGRKSTSRSTFRTKTS